MRHAPALCVACYAPLPAKARGGYAAPCWSCGYLIQEPDAWATMVHEIGMERIAASLSPEGKIAIRWYGGVQRESPPSTTQAHRLRKAGLITHIDNHLGKLSSMGEAYLAALDRLEARRREFYDADRQQERLVTRQLAMAQREGRV